MHDSLRNVSPTARGSGLGLAVALGLVGACLSLVAACGEEPDRPTDAAQGGGGRPAPRTDSGGDSGEDQGELGQTGAALTREAGADPRGAGPLGAGPLGAGPLGAGPLGAGGTAPEPPGMGADDPGEGEPPMLPSIDELVAGLDAPPEDLAVVVDPTLLLASDPPRFPVSRTVGGEPVEILREYHPTTNVLLRIALVRPMGGGADPGSDDGSAPILHGPQWRYYDTAALRTEQWFKDGVAHGPSRQWRRVGTKVFEGRFWNGERDGLRREYSKNGQLISVRTYVKGRQQGQQEDWFASGQREEESEYLDDQLHGRRRVWSREGLLVLDETYEHGVLHGRWTDFHPVVGTPREWGAYVRGKRDGIWQRGAENGTIVASIRFADGKPHGRSQIWNPEGRLVEEYVNVEGQRTGTSRTWYADGTPQSEGELEKGLRVGRWTYWKSDGSLNERWTGIYADDLKISDSDD